MRTKLERVAHILTIAATLFAAATLGACINEAYVIKAINAQLKPYLQHEEWVGENRGFVVGCKFAISSGRQEDVIDPIWTEFCVKNASARAQATEPKDSK